MKFKKDLIVVHFQEGFFKESNQELKEIVKKEIETLVDKAMRSEDIHISFWKDSTSKNPKSILTIPKLQHKISEFEATGGRAFDYQLKGSEVILVGGFFGACVNRAIVSVLDAFIKNLDSIKTESLTIRLPINAVYTETELLSEINKNNIISKIVSVFESYMDDLSNNSLIKTKGLCVEILKAGKEPFFKKSIYFSENHTTGNEFKITFLLVD